MRKLKLPFALTLAATSLVACAAYSPPPNGEPFLPPGVPFPTPPPPSHGGSATAQVSFGAVAQLNQLTIAPRAIVEDSRCPATVQCIWQGRFRLSVNLEGPGFQEQRTFELGVPQPVPGGTLTLFEVTPEKGSPDQAGTPDYLFTFSLTR